MIIIGVIISVAGIISIIYGVNLNNSWSAQLQSLFSSGSSNPGTTYIVLGVIGLLAGLIMIIYGIVKQQQEENNSSHSNENNNFIQNSNHLENSNNYSNEKKCPFCAEMIKKEAIICRYCGKDIEEYENHIKPKEDENIKYQKKQKKNNLNEKNENEIIEDLEKQFDITTNENEKIKIAKKLYALGKQYYWRFIPKDKK